MQGMQGMHNERSRYTRNQCPANLKLRERDYSEFDRFDEKPCFVRGTPWWPGRCFVGPVDALVALLAPWGGQVDKREVR